MGLFKKDPNEEFLKNADLKYHAMLYVPIQGIKDVPNRKSDGTFLNEIEKLQFMEDQASPYNITVEIDGNTVWDGPPRTTLLQEDGYGTYFHKMSTAAVMVDVPVMGSIFKMKPLKGKALIQSEYAAKSKPHYFVIEPMLKWDNRFPTGYSYCRPGVWSMVWDQEVKGWVRKIDTSMLKEYNYLAATTQGFYKTGDNSAVFSEAFVLDEFGVVNFDSPSGFYNFKDWEKLPSGWRLPDWKQFEYEQSGPRITFTGRIL